MQLIFEKLKIHNFMSFKDQEFNLNENRGLTLVCGKNLDIKNSKNGVGKSTLFSAILYALFGELQYTIKNENLRNKYVNDKEMWVEIIFNINKKRYSLKRSLKGKQTIIDFKEIDSCENILADLNRSSILETDTFIQREIINCDISVFLRTIFLSSEQNYNFFKLSPSAKRDFIEKIFNISIFGEMYTLIHRDLLKTDKEITSSQNKLIVLNRNEEQYNELLEKFNNEKTSKINIIKEDIKNLLSKEKELLNISIENVDSNKVSEIENKIDILNNNKSENLSKINKLNENLHTLLRTKTKYLAEIESKKKIINSHEQILSELCNDCNTVFKKYYSLDKINSEIDSIENTLPSIEEKISKINTTIEKFSSQNNKIENDISIEVNNLHALIDDSNKFKHELSSVKKSIDEKNILLNNTENEINPYTKLFENNHNEIISENTLLEEISNKYNYLKFIENIVSADTLKKFIIKDLIGLLNIKIKYYLAKLGANFQCIFDENMNCDFITQGGSYDYQNFSSGEQMRLMIAACFAFKDFMQTRNNFQSNILILDEFIDSGIDSLAIDGVVKILREFTKLNKQTIYVISHRTGDLDNSVFDSIIQIEKKNNISVVKYLENEK